MNQGGRRKRLFFSIILLSFVNFPFSTFIQVVSPNGGETLWLDSVYSIQWNDDIAENVKIELFKRGFHALIVGNTESDGEYSWNVSNLGTGNDFQIKVSSVILGSMNDLSDANFSIQSKKGTYINGSSVSGIWKKEFSPYYIQNDIIVPVGYSLTIEPGVKVIFLGAYNFDIEGYLLALGAESDSILFTQENAYKRWGGIWFKPSTDTLWSEICYARIEFAQNARSVIYHGAVSVDNRYVLIENCTIINNSIVFTEAEGSGIYGYVWDKLLIISKNSILNNSISNNPNYPGQPVRAYGGGLYCEAIENGRIDVVGNLIKGNSTTMGGGINSIGNVVIKNNAVLDNKWGGIIYRKSLHVVYNNQAEISSNMVQFNIGTGIGCEADNLSIKNNIVSYNQGWSGAGMNINSGGSLFIQNNIIIHNNALGGNGGGVVMSGGGGAFTGNVVTKNTSQSAGGGVYCIDRDGAWVISNNTIVYNEAVNGGGMVLFTQPTIINSIIYGNTASNSGAQIYYYEDSPSFFSNVFKANFYYCDIQGGLAGFGYFNNALYEGTFIENIDADPLFTDTASLDFSLTNTSPCVDRGYPAVTDSTLADLKIIPADLAGKPRIFNGRIDIGAYENDGTSAVITGGKPSRVSAARSFPNPFQDATMIEWTIAVAGSITLSIINPAGQVVVGFFRKDFLPGTYTELWDGRDRRGKRLPSGIYYYHIASGGQTVSGRLLLVQ